MEIWDSDKMIGGAVTEQDMTPRVLLSHLMAAGVQPLSFFFNNFS